MNVSGLMEIIRIGNKLKKYLSDMRIEGGRDGN